MVDFKLNLTKLNKEINEYKNCKNSVKEELDFIYGALDNTDSAWNDDNSISFMKTIKSDKNKIEEYITNLDILYKKIENFKDNIISTINKYGYKKFIYIKYNENRVNVCITKLKNVLMYLKNALYYLEMCNITSGFEEYYKVKKLKIFLKETINDINGIINTINSFRNSINTIINYSRSDISKVSGFDLNVNTIEYNWKLTSPEIKRVEKNEYINYTNNKARINTLINKNMNSDIEVLNIDK